MDLNSMIDVVLGLVLLYLLLGLICTVVNEAIASFAKLRARNLKARLEKIIDNPDLRKALDATGAMRSLKAASGNSIGPSYIPSRTMAMAVVDALNPDKKLAAELGLAELKQSIEKLQGPDAFKSMILKFADEAEDDVQQFRTEIANWFDDAMERVGGVYRRWMRGISLAVAFVICLAMNADSIRISKALWADDSLRAQVADQALKISQSTDIDQKKLAALHDELRPFPLGWEEPLREDEHIMLRIIGLLISAFAVSLGAPFWFDILKRFADLRGSGAAPPRADGRSAGSPDTGKAGSGRP